MLLVVVPSSLERGLSKDGSFGGALSSLFKTTFFCFIGPLLNDVPVSYLLGLDNHIMVALEES